MVRLGAVSLCMVAGGRGCWLGRCVHWCGDGGYRCSCEKNFMHGRCMQDVLKVGLLDGSSCRVGVVGSRLVHGGFWGLLCGVGVRMVVCWGACLRDDLTCCLVSEHDYSC